MNPTKSTKSVAPILFWIFSIFWLLLAIDPSYRNIWIAENVILIMGIIYLVTTHTSSLFSNRSYWLIFAFCILQTIGAHYTYAEVPIGFWAADLLQIERNHYDRLVHFSFGFLLVLPFREAINPIVKFHHRQLEVLVLVVIFLGIGSLYEIIEWLYAIFYEQSSQTADSFLGSQGDIWDAEKDMALAGLGAWLMLVLTQTTDKQSVR